MGKRRQKSPLERLCDSLRTTELRLRLSDDLPQPAQQKHFALLELRTAHTELEKIIQDIARA